jgi:very-short-patch-repair endonuclease
MRAAKRAWLAEHDYKIVEVKADAVEKDLEGVLESLAAAIHS